MRLPKKFITSFMDIILSTLGAFFLLLLILATNRQTPGESGNKMPNNSLGFRVINTEYNLRFYENIGFWIAIEEDDGTFSEILRSDELCDDEQNENKDRRLIFTDKVKTPLPRLVASLGVSDDDRSRVVFGFYLRELPPDFPQDKRDDFNNRGITIRVDWNRNENHRQGVLSAENNFEILLKPGVGEYKNFEKVAYSKPDKYEQFPHFVPEECTQNSFINTKSDSRNTILCYNYDDHSKSLDESAVLKQEGYLMANYHENKKTPTLFSKEVAGFSKQRFDQGNSDSSIVKTAAYDAQQLLNRLDSELLNSAFFERIKFIHIGSRAVVLILNDDSIMYHMMASVYPNNVYAYRNWTEILPSPKSIVNTEKTKDDSEKIISKWETITAEQVNELRQQYPDWQNDQLKDDFIYAFAGVLAQPLPDCESSDEPLPFRRNPALYFYIKKTAEEKTDSAPTTSGADSNPT